MNHAERVFNFGRKRELAPKEKLEQVYGLAGIEQTILDQYVTERTQLLQQAELVGDGMTYQDEALLDRLAESILNQLSEHGIDEVSAADLEAFVESR